MWWSVASASLRDSVTGDRWQARGAQGGIPGTPRGETSDIGCQHLQDAILAGYRDLAAGRVFASSGDFKTDLEILNRKESDGWQ